MSLQLSSLSTGFRCHSELHTNCVCSCTLFILDAVQRTELVTATSELPSRRSLRSASSQQYEVPRTKLKFGERSFSFAGPAAWNALTPELHNLSNTHTFKKQLKTYLFNKAYSWYRPTSNCNAPLVTPGVNGAVEMTLFVFFFVFLIIIGRLLQA